MEGGDEVHCTVLQKSPCSRGTLDNFCSRNDLPLPASTPQEPSCCIVHVAGVSSAAQSLSDCEDILMMGVEEQNILCEIE